MLLVGRGEGVGVLAGDCPQAAVSKSNSIKLSKKRVFCINKFFMMAL
jgi:hypothetical protein